VAAEKIAEKGWPYTLYRLEDGAIVLSVLCESSALYEINILLNTEVADRTIADERFLEALAGEIREHPGKYSWQSIVL